MSSERDPAKHTHNNDDVAQDWSVTAGVSSKRAPAKHAHNTDDVARI